MDGAAEELRPAADLEITLERYAQMFDLAELGDKVGYPMYIKPYDGGGWAGVSRIDNADDLQRLYDESGTYLMHLQQAVDPHDLFIRCVGLGPQVRVVRYDPGAPLHDRYTADDGDVPDDQRQHLIDTTLTINSFFGWDFNSCEALRKDDAWFPIDFANPCPDSQVTSLHYHFPWLIAANLRWSLFCAATKRPMRPNLDWQPYFDIADTDAPYEEKLKGYAAIARERLQTDAVRGVLRRSTSAISIRCSGTSSAPTRPATPCGRRSTAMYPDHEVDEFTEMFWSRIQQWRQDVQTPVTKLTERWHSVHLDRTVEVARWGDVGTPGARVSDGRRRRRGDRTFPRGRRLCRPDRRGPALKIYSCDSVNGRAMLTDEGDSRHLSWMLRRFVEFVGHELVPAIRADCHSDDHRDHRRRSVDRCVQRPGLAVSLPRRLHRRHLHERYLRSPTLPERPGTTRTSSGPRRCTTSSHSRASTSTDCVERSVVLACGGGANEDIGESWQAAYVLGSAGVPNRVDEWGPEWPHDWQTWRAMLPPYLAELT